MHLSATLWLHLIGAALLVGGGIIFGLIIVPSARLLPEAQRATYIAKLARRFANVAWIALALLLLTGLYQLNLHNLPLMAVFKPQLVPGRFGEIFAAKMHLFWLLVAINVLEEIANPMLRRRERHIQSAPAAKYQQGSLAKLQLLQLRLNAGMGVVILILALAVLYFGVQLTLVAR